jgi:hypothetical protein
MLPRAQLLRFLQLNRSARAIFAAVPLVLRTLCVHHRMTTGTDASWLRRGLAAAGTKNADAWARAYRATGVPFVTHTAENADSTAHAASSPANPPAQPLTQFAALLQ